MLRTVGQWMGKIRRMASEFQGQFQEAMREAEMADLKKQVDEMTDAAKGFTDFDPLATREEGGRQLRPPIRSATAPTPPPTPRRSRPAAVARGRGRADARPRRCRLTPSHAAAVAGRCDRAGSAAARTPSRSAPVRGAARDHRGRREGDRGHQGAADEHLIELRSRLIKALVAFFVAAAFCFFFAKHDLQHADLALRLGRRRRRTPSSSTPRCSNISSPSSSWRCSARPSSRFR